MRGPTLLTVAIPTYNRADYLDLGLRRLKEELMRLHENQRTLIRIYISNNASTDDTINVISIHGLHEICELEVITNSVNVGAEKNVIQCYESASTPYVWILGDDDVMLQGALEKVLSVLLLNQPDIVYLGNYHFLDDYLDTKCALKSEKEVITLYENSEKFTVKTNVMLTFISALVVRSGRNHANLYNIMNDTYLSHLGWILPLLRDGSKFVAIESWVVAAKGGNTGGYGLIRVFGENLQMITKQILIAKPREAKAIENGTIINFFPGFILELRSGHSKFVDNNIERGLKDAFCGNWRYYAFLLPLMRLPMPIAYRYHGLLNKFRRFFGDYLV